MHLEKKTKNLQKVIENFEQNYESFVAQEKKKSEEKERKPIRVRNISNINNGKLIPYFESRLHILTKLTAKQKKIL